MSLTAGLIWLAIGVFVAVLLISLRDARRTGRTRTSKSPSEPVFARYAEWSSKRKKKPVQEPALPRSEQANTIPADTTEPNLPDPIRAPDNIPAKRGPVLTLAKRPIKITEPILQTAAAKLSEKIAPTQTLDHSMADTSDLGLDYIAYLPGDETLNSKQVWATYRQNEYLLEKPHQLFGYHLAQQTWQQLEQGQGDAQYTDLAITLQLTNANGEVSESDLTRFSQLVLRLAEQFSRRFQFVGTFEEAQLRASQLDVLRQRFDLMLVLNILPRQDFFRGLQIQRCAEQSGLQLGIERVFDYPPEAPVFRMANLYNPGYFENDQLDRLECRGLTLFLRVPVVDKPLQQFKIMVNKTRVLAEALHGNLVDENSNPLGEHGIHLIDQQLSQLITQMSESGIEPGGKLARRLF